MVGTELYLAVEIRARYEGYTADVLRKQVELQLRKARTEVDAKKAATSRMGGRVGGGAASTAGHKRGRGEMSTADSEVESLPLPPGYHYLPTADDYDAIASTIEGGYFASIDSWSLGVILVRMPQGRHPHRHPWWCSCSIAPSHAMRSMCAWLVRCPSGLTRDVVALPSSSR